jgi:hypothetical protein
MWGLRRTVASSSYVIQAAAWIAHGLLSLTCLRVVCWQWLAHPEWQVRGMTRSHVQNYASCVACVGPQEDPDAWFEPNILKLSMLKKKLSILKWAMRPVKQLLFGLILLGSLDRLPKVGSSRPGAVVLLSSGR